MSQEKKSTVGSPIWVESVLTPDEYLGAHKKFPALVQKTKAILYDPAYHEGGKWRAGMGKGYTPDEIKSINKHIDNLYNLLKTKKFQHRPEYGPENEMKP